MEFKLRKKGKYKEAERFVERMKNIQEKIKAILQKAQKDMKRYADREREEAEEYKIGNLGIQSWQLSTTQCHKPAQI